MLPSKSISRTDSTTSNVCAAHRAGVHAQRAADAAGNAFEKFHAAQAVPPGFNRDIFQFRARAAAQPFSRQFQSC